MAVSPARRTAVVLDRQRLWLEAVESVLARIDVAVAGKETSPEAALELVATHAPDVTISGISMPEGEIDGIEFVREARRRQPDLRAIVLSSRADPVWIDRALAAGAVAYVVKSAHPDDLASTIRQAFEHSVYLAAAPLPAASDGAAELTRRERQILRLVAEGRSNGAVARLLWVTEQTVKFHLSNVYRKLGVSNRTEAARWAQRTGLLADDAVATLRPVDRARASA